jgi:hypothetical protein
MQVRVTYTRPGKQTTIYLEDLVADDGRRLTTSKALPPDIQQLLTEALIRQNLMPPGRTIGRLRKHYFFAEYFNVLEFIDTEGEVVGYYSDIMTPLRRGEGSFFGTDLFLDVWMAPGQPALGLDEDEFAQAIKEGLVSPEDEAQAWRAYRRLLEEAERGLYPYEHIR